MSLGVGQRHPDHGAQPRLQVLGGEPFEAGQGLLVGVDQGGDRDGAQVQAGTPRVLGGVGAGVLGRVRAGVGDAVHVGRADGVAGQLGDDGGVDPARHAEQHRRKSFLRT